MSHSIIYNVITHLGKENEMNDTYKSAETVIRGFKVELEIEGDGDDIVSSCFVYTPDQNYGSSLALLMAEGFIEHDNGYDVKRIRDYVRNEIEDWALENGY